MYFFVCYYKKQSDNAIWSGQVAAHLEPVSTLVEFEAHTYCKWYLKCFDDVPMQTILFKMSNIYDVAYWHAQT